MSTSGLVSKTTLPKIEKSFEQSFAHIYPIISMVNEAGHSVEARAFFERIHGLPLLVMLKNPNCTFIEKFCIAQVGKEYRYILGNSRVP
jgi:hypothetical protein